MRVLTEEDLDLAQSHFASCGLPTKWVEVPFQGRTLHTTDVVGTPLELCATMQTEPRRIMHFEAFHGACPQRLDHFQVLTPEVRKACEFYMAMGFRLSEYIVHDDRDDLRAVFLQRKGNQWDLVFLTREGPRFHHFGYVIESMPDMIRACDCAANTGFAKNIEHGPARHGASHSYYTYLRDPDGNKLCGFYRMPKE